MEIDPDPYNLTDEARSAPPAPRGAGRGRRGGSPGSDRRKSLQLCRQVAHALDYALSDCGDDVLRDLQVRHVAPLGGVSQLLVTVGPLLADPNWDIRQAQDRLAQFAGRLRAEVAQSINRRRTPKLLFQVSA